MKTLIAIGKAAALFSSPLLLALYVYDRSGGNLFAPRLAPATNAPANDTRRALPDPGGVTVSFSPAPSAGRSVELTKPIVMTPKSGPVELTSTPQSAVPNAPPTTLFPGSKSFSGATVIDAGTLQTHRPEPALSVQPKPMMFPGSKSIVMPSMIEQAPATVNAPNAPYQRPNVPPNQYQGVIPQQGVPQQNVPQQAVPR